MYRLLIVDNERLIVDNLVDLFQKSETLALEVFGVYTAAAALELMARMKIDIVLSDIRMPGMNGLELQQEINLQWPLCKVIFLSGYDDFEYIQQAMRNSGVDYLLKTEGERKIEETVAKAVRQLDDAVEKEQLIAQARERMSVTKPLLHKEFLWAVLLGEPQPLRHLAEQFAGLDIPLDADAPVLLAVGRVDDWKDGFTLSDRELLVYAIRNIAEEYWHGGAKSVSVAFDKNKIVWMIQPNESVPDGKQGEQIRARTVRFAQGMAESIQQTSDQLLKLSLSLAVASDFRPWPQAAEQFENLKLLLNFGAGLGRGALILGQQRRGEPLPAGGHDHAVRSGLKALESLAAFLENGQRHQFFIDYAQLMAIGGGEGTELLRMEIDINLAAIFLSYINRWGLHAELAEGHDLTRLLHFNDRGAWTETTAYYTALAEELFEIKRAGQTFQENDIVKHVQWYVDQNLAGDLSLTRIGEVVGHNPYYLSRLYKQITNEGLSEFIARSRMRKAKELLGQQGLRISDIAKSVGFSTDQSFYRLFKKAAGVTPQEYREHAAKVEK